jgi:hypothetical protein
MANCNRRPASSGRRKVFLEQNPLLLWVREIGGYPDFTSLYKALGYRLVCAQGVRKALSILKQLEPQVVVAEFNYAPTYGVRISSVEPLLARIQSHHPLTRVLLLAEKERLKQALSLKPAYGEFSVQTYPVQVADLERFLLPNG